MDPMEIMMETTGFRRLAIENKTRKSVFFVLLHWDTMSLAD